MGVFRTKKENSTSSKYLVYQPKADITAFEVAQCLAVVIAGAHGSRAMIKAYASLPTATKRHFEVVKGKSKIQEMRQKD